MRKQLSKYIIFLLFGLICHIFILSSNVFAEELKKPMLYIDEPAFNQTVSRAVKIRGWALNKSGIKEINILVDDVFIGKAVIGLNRDDVDKAFPGYIGGANSGYEYMLDLSSIREGIRSIRVQAIGNDLSKMETSFNINVKKLKPLLYVDEPAPNKTVSKSIKIRGWALNESGTKEINIYLDEKFIGKANTGLLREDVAKVFPGYADGANGGYEYILDLNPVSEGSHVLKIESISNDSSKTVANVNIYVNKLKSILYIDSPSPNAVVRDNIVIRGWAISELGVKKIDVLANDELVGQATIGIPRPDVARVFPTHKGSDKSGFTFNLDISKYNNKPLKISLQATGNNGEVFTSSFIINIDKPSPILYIDEPNFNMNYKGIVKIRGWTLGYSPIQAIEVMVDGNKIGEANYGIIRTDVAKAFPQYNNNNSGFEYLLDADSIGEGKHDLTIRARSSNGTYTDFNKTITVEYPMTIIYIDSPAPNASLAGYIDIRGWAIDYFGINRAEVLVDGVKVGEASYGIVRSDVNKIFGEYRNSLNSGFEYRINTKSLSQGAHLVTIRTTNTKGRVNKQNISINLVKPNPIVYIDAPQYNEVIFSTYTIKGWALNSYGVNKVEIEIDGTKLGEATYGLLRNDVADAFPNYIDGNLSGFEFTFESTQIKNGKHSLTVIVTGQDGTVTKVVRTFNILNTTEIYVNYDKTLNEMVNIQMGVGPMYYSSGGFIPATPEQVEYYLNPKNFMDEYGKLQFLRLNYTYGISAEEINNVIAEVQQVKYGDSYRTNILLGKGEVFLRAAKQYDISPIYLVAHALLETGYGTSDLAQGIVVSDGKETKVVYNMFGIGAKDQDPTKLGAEYAYNAGWFTVDDAIIGGAEFISKNYINNPTRKQNTLYKMRWNPDNPGKLQYASDVRWAYNQVKNIKKMIDKLQNAVLIYEIPVYKEN